MEPSTGIKTWQWVVTVIVIIVLIIIGILVFGGSSTQEPGSNEPIATSTEPGATAPNRIVMSDQYPGNVVYISSVQLEKPGFVVIQGDKNGTPGDVIGSAYFDKGISPGRITLTKPTVEGGTYYAVLYTDTNGNRTFDAGTDKPVTDASGRTVMKLFRVSASVGEIKG